MKFKCLVFGTLTLFLGMLLFVTLVAFGRTSGGIGLDMANIQLLRMKS